MPLIAVCNDAAPVPLVFNVNVAVNDPVAPPSAAVVVPLSVTVALSLSVTFTVPDPVSVTDALEVVSAKLAVKLSGPSTNCPSADGRTSRNAQIP